METQSLWPDFVTESAKSPKAILKEQAGYLMEKTNNVLSAEVETLQGPNDQLVHHFYVVAPAMNNYRYRVLSVIHGIFFYPLDITGNNFGLKADNQEEFIKTLGEIFNEPEIIRVVSSLLSQSLAE